MSTVYQTFPPWRKFEPLLASLLEEKSEKHLVASLDQFLSALYRPFSEPRLSNALELMMGEGGLEVGPVATTMGISRKTLLRLFEKHLSCSPTAFTLQRIQPTKKRIEKS